MVTQTITKPLFGASGHDTKQNLPYYTSIVIDFNTQSHTSTDVFEVIHLPAGTMVLGAGVEKLTADSAGNSNTLALADGSVTYVTAAVSTGTGQMTGLDAIGELFVHFAAANTLDLTLAGGTANGKVRVWAVLLDTSNPITAQRVTFA